MTDLTNKGAGPKSPAARFAERLVDTADQVSLKLLERLADRAAAATRAVGKADAPPPTEPHPARTTRPFHLPSFAARARKRAERPDAPQPPSATARLPSGDGHGDEYWAGDGPGGGAMEGSGWGPGADGTTFTTCPSDSFQAEAGRRDGLGAATFATRLSDTLGAGSARLGGSIAALAGALPPRRRPALPRLSLATVTLPTVTLPRAPALWLPEWARRTPAGPPKSTRELLLETGQRADRPTHLPAVGPLPSAPHARRRAPAPLLAPIPTAARARADRPAAPADRAAEHAPAAQPVPALARAMAPSAAPHAAATPSDALSLAGQLEGHSRGPSAIIWISLGVLGAFLSWAALAPLDEIVRAEGEFVSSSRPQIIQNLEGGILAELMVGEGDIVNEGDTIARLYGTAFQTSVDDLADQIAALEIRRLRLEAEMAGLFDVTLPEALVNRMPDIAVSERALLAARQADYVARTDGARAVLSEAEQEKDILEGLWEDRIVALIEVTRARRTFSDAQAHLDEIVTTAELDRASEYSDTLKELGSLRQQLRLSEDQLKRSTLTSPLKGTVNKLTITTIGGVVRPGEEIMQIVPLGEELFVEAQVRPRDIGNVQPGQKATIKLSAYDYTIYGSLQGTVRFVSADTFRDERRAEAEPHYRATVAVDASALTHRQRNISIRPGMQALVELHTGAKTVLQYLTRPLHKAREAMREP